MNKTKRTALYVMGGMAALGVAAYCMMPREDKRALKHMIANVASKGSCSNNCCLCDK